MKLRFRAPGSPASRSALPGVVLLVCALLAAPAPTPGQAPREVEAEEEVRFESGDLVLGGLFLAPEGEGPFPTAVFIRGSGPSSRDSYWARAIVDVLNAAGVAALLPDKRGSDASEGDWRTADFDDLAGDALAGVRYARSRPDVLGSSVGLVGLSQGGKIAPVAAARSDDVAWVVNFVGGATTFREQVSWEMYHTFREAGVGARELQTALALQVTAEAYVRGRAGWQEYRRLLDEALSGPWAEVAAGFPASRDAWQWSFFRGVFDFDPLPHWRRTRQPVLAFFGEDDHNAPAVRSAYRLVRAFRETGHGDAVVRIVPGVGHALWDPGTAHSHRPELDPRVVDALTRWLRVRVR